MDVVDEWMMNEERQQKENNRDLNSTERMVLLLPEITLHERRYIHQKEEEEEGCNQMSDADK